MAGRNYVRDDRRSNCHGKEAWRRSLGERAASSQRRLGEYIRLCVEKRVSAPKVWEARVVSRCTGEHAPREIDMWRGITRADYTPQILSTNPASPRYAMPMPLFAQRAQGRRVSAEIWHRTAGLTTRGPPVRRADDVPSAALAGPRPSRRCGPLGCGVKVVADTSLRRAEAPATIARGESLLSAVAALSTPFGRPPRRSVPVHRDHARLSFPCHAVGLAPRALHTPQNAKAT